MSAEKKKIRCHVNTREQRSSRKYRTLIITNKKAVVKANKLTCLEVIKTFDAEQMACFIANFQKLGKTRRNVKRIKQILESEAPI